MSAIAAVGTHWFPLCQTQRERDNQPAERQKIIPRIESTTASISVINHGACISILIHSFPALANFTPPYNTGPKQTNLPREMAGDNANNTHNHNNNGSSISEEKLKQLVIWAIQQRTSSKRPAIRLPGAAIGGIQAPH